MKRIILTDKDININPNCHAEYFTVSDDGVLSLKPEYMSDGNLNAELPADLVIPEIVDEMAVDRLSAGMFMNNTIIESLTLPSTVDEIPENFCNMAVNLKELKNTEHIAKVGASGFLACKLEKVVMPNLEQLGTMAFGRNAHLVYADIGKTSVIEANVFRNDISLTKVKSKGNITSIGEGAFGCTPRLNNVNFVDSLTSIGAYGFIQSGFDYDWDSLTNCTFGNKATWSEMHPIDFWSDITPTPCENPIPTALCQKDSRWNNRTWNPDNPTDHYYGKNGCGLMCVMHAYCGINNLTLSSVTEFENIVNAVNPDLLKNYIGYHSCYETLLEGLGITAKAYETTVVTQNWNAETLTALYNTLANGGYALVNVQTSGAHVVCVYGVNEKKELLYIDSDKFYYYDDSKPRFGKLPIYQLVGSTHHFTLVSR